MRCNLIACRATVPFHPATTMVRDPPIRDTPTHNDPIRRADRG